MRPVIWTICFLSGALSVLVLANIYPAATNKALLVLAILLFVGLMLITTVEAVTTKRDY